jgi:hypothetical protein
MVHWYSEREHLPGKNRPETLRFDTGSKLQDSGANTILKVVLEISEVPLDPAVYLSNNSKRAISS